jgi:hypothetical protein
MAFVTIPSGAIDVGDPITADLFSKIKNGLDDHELRIGGVENAQNRIIVFNTLYVNGASANTLTGLDDFNATTDLVFVAAYVQIYEKGSLTGAIEIDVKVNSTPNNVGMSSIFSTKPKITYSGASDYAKSTNQVFDIVNNAASSGDSIRLDVTELPGGGTIGKFRVVLIAEVA